MPEAAVPSASAASTVAIGRPAHVGSSGAKSVNVTNPVVAWPPVRRAVAPIGAPTSAVAGAETASAGEARAIANVDASPSHGRYVVRFRSSPVYTASTDSLPTASGT